MRKLRVGAFLSHRTRKPHIRESTFQAFGALARANEEHMMDAREVYRSLAICGFREGYRI